MLTIKFLTSKIPVTILPSQDKQLTGVIQMAKKYDVKTTDTGVIFVDNKTNKVVDLDGSFCKRVSLVDALNANRAEISKRGELTDACMSFMVELLKSPKLGSWAGRVKMGHSIPSEMKKSMRDVENDVIKPVYDADWKAKNPAPDSMDSKAQFDYQARLENQWRDYIERMREGGIYGQCKSASVQFLAYYGKLPCVHNADGSPDTDKLFRPSVILKMIANDMVRETDQLTGINKLLQEVQKLLEGATITEIEAKDGIVRALDIAKTLQAINDGYAQAATAKAQGLPITGVALQSGDKVQDAETSIAKMAKQALDKAAIKPTKPKKSAKSEAKMAPVSAEANAAPM